MRKIAGSWVALGMVVALAGCGSGGGGSTPHSAAPGTAPSSPITVSQGTSTTGQVPANGNSYYSFTTGPAMNYDIALSNVAAQGSSIMLQSAGASPQHTTPFSRALTGAPHRTHGSEAAARVVPQTVSSSIQLTWTLFTDQGFNDALGSCPGSNCLVPLNANTAYYLRVENGSPQSASFTLLVKTTVQQGFADQPVSLSIGVPFAATVDGGGVSFYTFITPGNTGSPVDVVISLSNSSTDIGWALFSDSGYSQLVFQCDDFASGMDQSCPVSLQTGTQYWLLIGDAPVTGSSTLSVADTQNQGLVGDPIPITEETAIGGTLGALGTSYYAFTASQTAKYSIGMVGLFAQLNWALYSDAAFTSQIASCSYQTQGKNPVCSVSLTSGTPYYLQVQEASGGAVTYILMISSGIYNQGTQSSPMPITITVVNQLSVDGFGKSFYTFTPSTSGPYQISASPNTEGLGSPGDQGWVLYDDSAFSHVVKLCHDFSYGSGVGRFEGQVTCNATLSTSTPYYLEVDQFAFPYRTVSTGNEVSVQITAVGPTTNFGSYGSLANPFTLQIGTTGGIVGPPSLGHDYFTFITSAIQSIQIYFSATGSISTNGSNVVWTLFSDSGFTSSLFVCDRVQGTTPQMCATPLLSANTPYYIRLDEMDDANPSDSGSFEMFVTQAYEEGSVASPVALVHGATGHAGMVDYLGKSYYTFSVSSPETYLIQLSSITTSPGGTVGESGSLGWFLYADTGFSTQISQCFFSDITVSPMIPAPACTVLLGNGTYYLIVGDPAGTGGGTYNLSITP